ncbi:MAG: hypothetical protein ACK5SX_16195 [Sandaracinobacter sp.]
MSAYLLRPVPILPSQITAGFEALLNPQPKVVFEVTQEAAGLGSWAIRFTVDFGQDTNFDTIALLFHNGPAGGLFEAYGRTSAQGPFASAVGGESPADGLVIGSPWRAAPPPGATRFHFVHAMPVAASRRYLRIVLFWPGPGPAVPFRAGIFAVGRRFQPGGVLGGFDWGAGRRVIDLSSVRTLPGGERGRWLGAKVPEVRGTWSHLTDAELSELWAIQTAVGESEPVLLVEAPDTLGAASAHDGIHYGLLTGLDFFERRQTDKSRVEVRLQHWL